MNTKLASAIRLALLVAALTTSSVAGFSRRSSQLIGLTNELRTLRTIRRGANLQVSTDSVGDRE